MYNQFIRRSRHPDISYQSATTKWSKFVMSAKSKVLAYLSKDSTYNTLTAQKMQALFGVANPSATIDDLRKEGHAIYMNSRMVNGEKVTFYRLGSPTKRMIAAGILALRQHGIRAFA
jgi:hypothetical protein